MIGNRIFKRSISRKQGESIKSLESIPSTVIDDAMGRLYAMSSPLTPLNDHSICGPPVTVRVPGGDNLFVHIALDMVEPGDILVVQTDQNINRATLGELMLRYLAKKDVGGVVVDGYVRDIEYIKNDCPFGVYARGISPNGPYKNGPGEINGVISCGNQVVTPETILKGDQDGIVVIPQDDLQSCIESSKSINSQESETLSKIELNAEFDRPWLAEKTSQL